MLISKSPATILVGFVTWIGWDRQEERKIVSVTDLICQAKISTMTNAAKYNTVLNETCQLQISLVVTFIKYKDVSRLGLLDDNHDTMSQSKLQHIPPDGCKFSKGNHIIQTRGDLSTWIQFLFVTYYTPATCAHSYFPSNLNQYIIIHTIIHVNITLLYDTFTFNVWYSVLYIFSVSAVTRNMHSKVKDIHCNIDWGITSTIVIDYNSK